jgi:hypothetical protein
MTHDPQFLVDAQVPLDRAGLGEAAGQVVADRGDAVAA